MVRICSLTFTYLFSLCVYLDVCICVLVFRMCTCTHMTHDVHVKVRGQTAEMGLLILFHWS